MKRHLTQLTVLLVLALIVTCPARADGTNQFSGVTFASINGPGTLALDRFITTGPRLAAFGQLRLHDDPELKTFAWGFYVLVASTDDGGIALAATGVGRLTDPTPIFFTRGVSPEQDVLIDAIRAELAAGGNNANLASLLNELRELYP